jgi:hypothetical protein
MFKLTPWQLGGGDGAERTIRYLTSTDRRARLEGRGTRRRPGLAQFLPYPDRVSIRDEALGFLPGWPGASSFWLDYIFTATSSYAGAMCNAARGNLLNAQDTGRLTLKSKTCFGSTL